MFKKKSKASATVPPEKEIHTIYDTYLSTPFPDSNIASKEDPQIENLQKIKLRCPNCPLIPALFSTNNSKFFEICSACENNHKITNMPYKEYYTKSTNASYKNCNSCNELFKDNKVFYCNKCNKLLCFICEKKHTQETTHTATNVDKIDFTCAKHNEKFTGFCKNCKINICIQCVCEHNNHNMEKYQMILPNVEEIKFIKENIKTERKDLEYFKEKFREFLDDLQYNFDEIVANIFDKLQLFEKAVECYDVNEMNFQVIHNIKFISGMQKKPNPFITEVRNLKEILGKFKGTENFVERALAFMKIFDVEGIVNFKRERTINNLEGKNIGIFDGENKRGNLSKTCVPSVSGNVPFNINANNYYYDINSNKNNNINPNPAINNINKTYNFTNPNQTNTNTSIKNNNFQNSNVNNNLNNNFQNANNNFQNANKSNNYPNPVPNNNPNPNYNKNLSESRLPTYEEMASSKPPVNPYVQRLPNYFNNKQPFAQPMTQLLNQRMKDFAKMNYDYSYMANLITPKVVPPNVPRKYAQNELNLFQRELKKQLDLKAKIHTIAQLKGEHANKIAVGLETGGLKIYTVDPKKNFSLDLYSDIKIFKTAVAYILPLRDGRIVSLHNGNVMRVIEIEKNFFMSIINSYKVIQEINGKENSANLLTGIELSDNSLVIGDWKHILVYRNKNINNNNNSENKKEEGPFYELVKDFPVNSPVTCLLQAEMNIFCSIHYGISTVFFYDMTSLNIINCLQNLKCCDDSSQCATFITVKNNNLPEKYLVIGGYGYLYLINTRRLQYVEKIYLPDNDYVKSVTSSAVLGLTDTIIVSGYYEGNNFDFVQYKIIVDEVNPKKTCCYEVARKRTEYGSAAAAGIIKFIDYEKDLKDGEEDKRESDENTALFAGCLNGKILCY